MKENKTQLRSAEEILKLAANIIHDCNHYLGANLVNGEIEQFFIQYNNYQFKPSGVGWISVEERLPEVKDGASEDVLCLGFKISPSREETATYEVMHWMKFDQPIAFKANGEPIEWGWSNKWWNNNGDYYHVFYWMPLPQSPE